MKEGEVKVRARKRYREKKGKCIKKKKGRD
jgi:hypothetical protein